MVAWEVIDVVKVDSKMQQKRWKNIINGMTDLDTDIKLSKRNLMVARKLYNWSGFAV